MADFYLKQGDTRSQLNATLQAPEGTPADITGATVKFSMKNKRTGVAKITEAAVTIVTAATGQVRYDWVAGDVDTAGEYAGEFEVTYAGGGIQTFPNSRDLDILIRKELA